MHVIFILFLSLRYSVGCSSSVWMVQCCNGETRGIWFPQTVLLSCTDWRNAMADNFLSKQQAPFSTEEKSSWSLSQYYNEAAKHSPITWLALSPWYDPQTLHLTFPSMFLSILCKCRGEERRGGEGGSVEGNLSTVCVDVWINRRQRRSYICYIVQKTSCSARGLRIQAQLVFELSTEFLTN